MPAAGHVVRYWRRDPTDMSWRVVVGDDVLRVHALPDVIDAMALAYAGRGLAADAIVPLRPSGRNEPFAFAFATPRTRPRCASIRSATPGAQSRGRRAKRARSAAGAAASC
jgi:hypothetical protein